MILIIDNFDSFTYNIVEYYKSNNNELRVFRNDAISLDEVEDLNPELIVLSPGPKDPNSAGITLSLISKFGAIFPIFGVCLGCQAIAQAFGGKIIRAQKMYHGKTSKITHKSQGVLKGIDSPVVQMRYHSLVIDPQCLPDCLEVTAWSEANEIMAVRHKSFSIEGVQFHPESVASIQGGTIMQNALDNARSHNSKKEVKRTHAIPRYESKDSEQAISEISDIIELLLSKQDLIFEQAASLMEVISENKVSAEQMALILTALRMKGETATEIAGIASIAKQKAVALPIKGEIPYLTDIVGTGGDGLNLLNISTAASFVAAGAGVKVAKHGNRAISSQCGSADVLSALGIDIELSAEKMAEMLSSTGMCFLFAPLYHPAMKYVAPVRKALKVRTIFNILGPLINPANVAHIVLGVYTKELMDIMAKTLALLGIKKAMVVYSSIGADELTLSGENYILEVEYGELKEYSLDAKTLIPSIAHISDANIEMYLKGGDAKYNSQLIDTLLARAYTDELQGSVIEAEVCLNAAAAIFVSGRAESMEEAIGLAYESIHSGAAQGVLQKMRDFS